MTFDKLPAVPSSAVHGGCLTCGQTHTIAPMGMYIGVGFGSADVTKDGEMLFDGEQEDQDEEMYELGYWEAKAELDPDHDWRVSLQGPLRGRTYQRQGKEHWVLVESNMGFA